MRVIPAYDKNLYQNMYLYFIICRYLCAFLPSSTHVDHHKRLRCRGANSSAREAYHQTTCIYPRCTDTTFLKTATAKTYSHQDNHHRELKPCKQLLDMYEYTITYLQPRHSNAYYVTAPGSARQSALLRAAAPFLTLFQSSSL